MCGPWSVEAAGRPKQVRARMSCVSDEQIAATDEHTGQRCLQFRQAELASLADRRIDATVDPMSRSMTSRPIDSSIRTFHCRHGPPYYQRDHGELARTPPESPNPSAIPSCTRTRRNGVESPAPGDSS